MNQTTDWTIRLKEVVFGPLKRITEMAGGAQKKISDLASTTSKFAKESSTAGRVASQSLHGLQDQLRRLQDLQSKAWDTRHVQNYQRAINKVREQITAWEAKKVLPESQKTGWFQRLSGKISEGMDSLPGFGMLKNPALLYGSAALAAISFGKAAVQTSMDWEYGMKKINATAQLPMSTLDKLDARLTEIGSHSGGNFSRVPEAYEKILSVNGKVNTSLDVLEVALKGAKAGFTDLDLVGSALAQTMAVVGAQNTTASEVMDTLLKAKAVGAGEFSDFATYLPQLTASARNIGTSMKETAGLFAFMTFKGQSAANAAMLMENAFTALQKKDIIVGLKKNGIDMFNKDGSRKAIDQILLDLTKKISGFTDKQKTKFFLDIGLNDAQARTAISVLTSDANNLARIMNDVANANGETDRQLALTGNQRRDWGDIGDQWKKIAKDFGEILKPVIVGLAQVLDGFIGGLNDFMSGEMFTGKNKAVRAYREELANKGSIASATEEYIKKFGFKPYDIRQMNSMSVTNKSAEMLRREQWFDDRKKYYKKAYLGSPNSIVKEEKEAGVTKGIPGDKGSGDITGSDITGGGNKGPKTLIMNLDIKNYFSKGDEKVKSKHTDDIVDAARDAMVTIGDE